MGEDHAFLAGVEPLEDVAHHQYLATEEDALRRRRVYRPLRYKDDRRREAQSGALCQLRDQRLKGRVYERCGPHAAQEVTLHFGCAKRKQRAEADDLPMI